MSLWTVFGSEVTGTAILILLGVGVVANLSLPKSSGNAGSRLVIIFGRGLAVSAGVHAAGASLGGPTGYAINPARDLGPRIAHAVRPIRGKGDSNWGYAWVPVVGPINGAVLAGAFSHVPL